MYGTSENPDRRRKLNSASNSRNTFTNGILQTMSKNEGHRLTIGGRLDNLVNEMKLGSLNKTKSNIVFKPPITLTKSNELFNSGISFDSAKNASKSPSNGHQSNVFSNDLGLFNQPDNIELPHTANQPADQELFGTNDIDKSRSLNLKFFSILFALSLSLSIHSIFDTFSFSHPFLLIIRTPIDCDLFEKKTNKKTPLGTRAEKSGNERTKPLVNQSKDHSRLSLGNRISNNLQSHDAINDSIKSDGRSGNSGEYDHQAENGASTSQNRIAYGACLLFSLLNSLLAFRFVFLHVN